MRLWRASLLIRLLGYLSLALAMSVIGVWLYARGGGEQLANRQTDMRMQAAAESYLSMFSLKEPGTAIAARQLEGPQMAADFPEVEVLDAQGRAIARSPRFPIGIAPSEDGFAQYSTPTGDWRTYTLTDPQTGTTCRLAMPSAARDAASRDLASTVRPILAVGPLALLLGYGALWLGLRPLRKISRALEEQDPHHPSPIVLKTTVLPPELRHLVTRLNGLLVELGEAMDRQRTFAGAAAHELRTPLASIQSQIDVATRTLDDQQRKTALERASHQISDLSVLIGRLLLLVKSSNGVGDGTKTDCDLGALFEEIEANLGGTPGSANIVFSRPDEAIRVAADPVLLRTMLVNLIENAVAASPRQGSVTVALTRQSEHATVVVADEGPGVPLANRNRIFEPFFSDTRRSGGFGLGLAIARNIARSHGGDIDIAASTSGGAAVRVSLPLVADKSRHECGSSHLG